MIVYNAGTQLEKESHQDKAQTGHKESSLQPSGKHQRQRHRQPFESDREAQILHNKPNRRIAETKLATARAEQITPVPYGK